MLIQTSDTLLCTTIHTHKHNNSYQRRIRACPWLRSTHAVDLKHLGYHCSMAPTTKGLSLFNLSSKKDKTSKSRKSSVDGGMVVKEATTSSEPAMDPKKAMLSDPKKSTSVDPVKQQSKVEEPAKKVEIRPEPVNAPATPAAKTAEPAPAPKATEITAPATETKKEEKKQDIKSESKALAVPALVTPPPTPAAASVAALPTPTPAKEPSVKEPTVAAAPAKPEAIPLPLAAEAAAKAVEMAAAAKANEAAAAAKAAEAAATAKAAAAAKEAAAREAAALAAAAYAAASKEVAAAAAAVQEPVAVAASPKVPVVSAISSSKPKPVSVKPAVQPVPEPGNMNKMRAEDARAAWQTRPRVPVRLLDSYVNFMVCGESGLGKTTFINNLVSSYTVTNKVHDGSSTSLADFQSDPDSLKTVLEPMEVKEAGRRLHVTVQDMPGWADDINLVRYLRIMVNFILAQRAKDYELLAGGRALNESAMCGQLQNSITACVYFLTPHRVKKVDLIMMSALSQLVTVIPVISKADTMTDDELAQFRQEIRTRLGAPYKYVHSKTLAPLDFNQFVFESGVMGALGVREEMLPLAIITSNKHETVDDAGLLAQLGLNADKVEQPVRAYKWGQAYALNREHSDLIILKRLLLGDRVDSLYAMLDESYNRYVAFCEQYEEAGKQLPLIVQDELACSAYLEYDDYSNAKSALDAAQQAMSTLMAENKALVERVNALEKEKGMRFRSSTSMTGM